MDVEQATDLKQLYDHEIAEELRREYHARDLRELYIARLAAEFATREKYDDDGFISPNDWIRFNCHVTSGAAANSIAVGEALNRMPQSTKAVVEGEIGFAHMTVMARTAEAVGDRFDEKALIQKARDNSPGKFHYICTHYRHAADPRGYAEEQAELVQNRRLKLSTWMDGTVLVSGQFDPEGGAVLLTALKPLARKSGAHGARFRARKGRPSTCATNTASGRGASGRQAGAQGTISCTGCMAARTRRRPWRCSAPGTTGWCTKATGSWCAATMGAF